LMHIASIQRTRVVEGWRKRQRAEWAFFVILRTGSGWVVVVSFSSFSISVSSGMEEEEALRPSELSDFSPDPRRIDWKDLVAFKRRVTKSLSVSLVDVALLDAVGGSMRRMSSSLGGTMIISRRSLDSPHVYDRASYFGASASVVSTRAMEILADGSVDGRRWSRRMLSLEDSGSYIQNAGNDSNWWFVEEATSLGR